VTVISGSSDSFSVVITVTEEPLLINPFIRDVIRSIHADIKKIYIVKGSVMGKKKFGDKIQYIITICLISGLFSLVKRSFIVLSFGFLNHMLSDPSQNPFSVAYTAKKHHIPVTFVNDINSASFLAELKNDKPTIIINQAQAILKEQFLIIPQVGSLNRHCGLLPKYRGRLAPFWALLKGEKESGVSIHFIDKEIDNGPILVQKKVPITRSDTFDSLLAKDFAIAPEAMVEAVGLIKSGEYNNRLIPNEKKFSSYYSSPNIRDALLYRKKLLKRWWYHE
jgi:folate-dependent phosphoribosylglycinamide formyltransferase PurN